MEFSPVDAMLMYKTLEQFEKAIDISNEADDDPEAWVEWINESDKAATMLKETLDKVRKTSK